MHVFSLLDPLPTSASGDVLTSFSGVKSPEISPLIYVHYEMHVNVHRMVIDLQTKLHAPKQLHATNTGVLARYIGFKSCVDSLLSIAPINLCLNVCVFWCALALVISTSSAVVSNHGMRHIITTDQHAVDSSLFGSKAVLTNLGFIAHFEWLMCAWRALLVR